MNTNAKLALAMAVPAVGMFAGAMMLRGPRARLGAEGVVTISRSKIVFRDMTNRRFPWKWIYDVQADGKDIVIGTDRVDTARQRAKAVAQGRPIIETWK